MSMALGIIGMLALIIGIVMLIVNAIRKSGLRVWGVIAGVGLVMFIVGVSLPGPAPTPVPAPAPETTEVAPPAEPTITPSEQAYATTIADHASRVSNAMFTLSDLMANPQYGNDEWTIKVAVELVMIRLLYDEAMEIDPPSSMANIHNKYIQAMKHYETSTYLIERGIDQLDANLIDQATTELLAGVQLVNEAKELIDEFTKADSK